MFTITDNLTAIWMSFVCIIAGFLGRNMKIKYVRGYKKGRFSKIQEELILKGFRIIGTCMIVGGVGALVLVVINIII